MLFLTVPSMVALMALNLPIISVLFQRGAFDVQDAVYTGQALFCYAMGLWAYSLLRVFVSSFYSLQDSKWPFKAAVITLIVNVLCSLALMYPLKHNGIALAGSISASVNVLILAFVLKKKIGAFLDRAFYTSLLKIVAASVIMLGAIGLIEYFMPWNTSAGLQSRLVFLASTVTAGACVFFISAYLLKSPEIHAFISMIQKRLTRS